MRTVLRYVDGRAIWFESVPANPGSSPIRGSLVVGASEASIRRAVVNRHREKARAEKEQVS